MPRNIRDIVRTAAALGFSAASLYAGYRFFTYSLGYLAASPPHVTAGLMAGLAGFTFVAAAAGVLRDWIIADKAAEALAAATEKGEKEGQ